MLFGGYALPTDDVFTTVSLLVGYCFLLFSVNSTVSGTRIKIWHRTRIKLLDLHLRGFLRRCRSSYCGPHLGLLAIGSWFACILRRSFTQLLALFVRTSIRLLILRLKIPLLNFCEKHSLLLPIRNSTLALTSASFRVEPNFSIGPFGPMISLHVTSASGYSANMRRFGVARLFSDGRYRSSYG